MKSNTKINVTYEDIVAALDSHTDPDRVWCELTARATNPFDGRRMIMWFGGVLALLASTIFLGTAGISFGVLGFGASLAAVMLMLISGGWFLTSKGHHFAGGLLATLFSGLVPLLVFSISDLLGVHAQYADYSSFYSYISSQWVWMEVATILVGMIVVWRFDFGFATLPPALAAYFFVMDAGVGLFDFGFATLSMVLGLVLGTAMVLVGVWFEKIDKPGHATWLLIYGLSSILFGANELSSSDTAQALIYLGLGLSFLLLGWSIERGIPVTIGALAVTSALAYLTYDVFDGSIVFSLCVFAVGVAIVVAATLIKPRTEANDADRSELGFRPGR